MQEFEYKVVPAPIRGEKAKGAKTTPDRFALALGNVINSLAVDGWEYLRADTLPCEERTGFTGRTTTTFQNMLVFRRAVAVEAQEQPKVLGVVAEPKAPTLAAKLGTPTPVAATAPKLNPVTSEGTAPALGPARDGHAAE